MFVPTDFTELIGNKMVLKQWSNAITNIRYGNIVLVRGCSGIGKTLGTRLLTKEYNSLFIDTNVSIDGKDILDRIQKFHNWIDLGSSLSSTNNLLQKIIIVDEIESFMRIDRNVLNTILSYKKKYGDNSIPIILIGHDDIVKKLGDIKHYITEDIRLPRLSDIDIFIFFKKRIPKNKIKLADLMKIVEESNGNMYSAMLTIQTRLNKKKYPFYSYVGDEQRSLHEIFECKNPLIIEKLLSDDDWVNPLKVHENSIKVLNMPVYQNFLLSYLYYEVWHHKLIGSIDNFCDIHLSFLAFSILLCMNNECSHGKIDVLDFSKLLSYISTKKKYRKLLHDKVPLSYPIEELGLFWVHNHIYSKKKRCQKNIL